VLATASYTSIEVDDSDDELVSENRITFPFLRDHPLYKTHQAQFNEKKSNVVPNFVGGSLPRCDRGDREYYCATMLALFKPWRTGHDLKSERDTWDETFNSQVNRSNLSKTLILDMSVMMLEMIFLLNKKREIQKEYFLSGCQMRQCWTLMN
jgi:hypothetical protein